MNPLWSSIHKQPAIRKKTDVEKMKGPAATGKQLWEHIPSKPGLDNEGWDKTVYFKISNLTPKSRTLLKVCFTLIEMESSGVDQAMFISKRKKTVSPRSSFLFSVYQLEIWLEICHDSICSALRRSTQYFAWGNRTDRGGSEWKLNCKEFNYRVCTESTRMWKKLRIQHIWIWLAPLISLAVRR